MSLGLHARSDRVSEIRKSFGVIFVNLFVNNIQNINNNNELCNYLGTYFNFVNKIVDELVGVDESHLTNSCF